MTFKIGSASVINLKNDDRVCVGVCCKYLNKKMMESAMKNTMESAQIKSKVCVNTLISFRFDSPPLVYVTKCKRVYS